jgi:mRNA interferase MazF
MTRYSFGDVIFVDYPFADAEESKRRPAVVICSELFQLHKTDILLLAITSQLRPIEALGEAAIIDWQQAGLPKPSVLKANIATVDSNRIIRKFGSLSDQDKKLLRALLAKVIS